MVAPLANINEFQLCEFLTTKEMLRMSEVSTTYLSYRNYLREIKIHTGENKKLRALRRFFGEKFPFVENIAFGKKCSKNILNNIIYKTPAVHFPRLYSLNFTQANITDELFDNIDFKCIPMISEINISENQYFTSTGCITLLHKLRENNMNIKKFYFEDTGVDDEGFNYFSSMVEVNCCIKHLSFGSCCENIREPSLFFKKMSEGMLTNLVELKFESLFIDKNACLDLSDAILRNHLINIKELSLSIDNDGVMIDNMLHVEDILLPVISAISNDTCPSINSLKILNKVNYSLDLGSILLLLEKTKELRNVSHLHFRNIGVFSYDEDTDQFMDKVNDTFYLNNVTYLTISAECNFIADTNFTMDVFYDVCNCYVLGDLDVFQVHLDLNDYEDLDEKKYTKYILDLKKCMEKTSQKMKERMDVDFKWKIFE
jgi:hypothetical protein